MQPIKLLIATRNRDKLREFANILRFQPFSLLTIDDLQDPPNVEEDQGSLHGNAVKKAMTLHQHFLLPSLADDTGLEVDALNGAPGVYSSRYAGPNAAYRENVDKLLRELAETPDEQRTARFRTVMALAHKGQVYTVEGVCEGLILREQRGAGGFGYDPIFFYPPMAKTLAEMSLQEKNRISHRALALQKMIGVIEQLFGA